MPSIAFDLETVTPLFLGGADPAIAELRPPAFRGALRYWFRALVGAYHSNNFGELKRIESTLLGDTSNSSSIILRLSNFPAELELDSMQLSQKQYPGLSYLWFSLKEARGDSLRQAIGVDEPVQFTLTFSTRPHPQKVKQQQKDLLVAANCFWLAVNLGGFGSRERRGAGSLRVRRVQHQGFDEKLVKGLPKFEIKFQSEVLPEYYKGQINSIQRRCEKLLQLETETINEAELPQLEILTTDSSTDIFRIYRVNKAYENWERALEDVGQRYSEYRSGISLKDRAVFGLPLKEITSRRPSPLRIKVVRSVHEYFCFLIRTCGAFPEGAGINNKSQFQLIDDFIENLKAVQRII